ncbi:MAG: hypothetical protein WDW38_010231 [Sanguina aurantia]
MWKSPGSSVVWDDVIQILPACPPSNYYLAAGGSPRTAENQWSAFTADGESAGGYGMLLLNNSLVCESVISVNDMVEGREAVVYAAAVAKARAVPSPASTLALAVIVPASVMGGAAVLGLITAGVLLFLLWWKHVGSRAFQLHLPPRHGSETTLAVTDIEGSTLAWEGLPLGVMDACVNAHNACIRHVMHKHHGHESATEGDSFIMAFHSASLAVAFATELQLELLRIQWPLELLQLPSSAPVCARLPVGVPAQEHAHDSAASASASMIVIGTGATDDLSSHLPFGILHDTFTDVRMASGTGFGATVAAKVQQLLAHKPTLTSQLSMEVSVTEGPRTYHQELVKLYTPRNNSFKSVSDGNESPQLQQTSLIQNGLRVRVGLHSGVDSCCVVYNKTEKRTQYTGIALQTTKAVCDTAQGGQVLLSDSTFTQLNSAYSSTLQSAVALLHMGEWRSVADGWPQNATALYQALPLPLIPRLAFLSTKCRALFQVSGGVLDAPVGEVTFLFMNMVGHKMLCAWNSDLMAQATSMYESTVSALLPGFNGYLVELSDGLCLASFPSARDAVGYALLCKEQLMKQDWPEELLAHEMCEVIEQFEMVEHNGHSEAVEPMATSKLIMRGPRIKVGIDCSVTSMRTQISPATGRMTYRGRAINRAARIADKATSGAVLCSEGAWAAYTADPRAEATPVLGCSIGSVLLKGIGSMGIVTCQYAAATITSSSLLAEGSSRRGLKHFLQDLHGGGSVPGSPVRAALSVVTQARRHASLLDRLEAELMLKPDNNNNNNNNNIPCLTCGR